MATMMPSAAQRLWAPMILRRVGALPPPALDAFAADLHAQARLAADVLEPVRALAEHGHRIEGVVPPDSSNRAVTLLAGAAAGDGEEDKAAGYRQQPEHWDHEDVREASVAAAAGERVGHGLVPARRRLEA